MRGSRLRGAVIAGVCVALARAASSPAATPTPADPGTPIPSSSPSTPTVLPELVVRDLPARGRLFDHGIPVAPESFSPDGVHFAYVYQIPGGFPRRKAERCTFLLDLSTLDNRPVKAPKGRAARIAGWDEAGRLLLLETTSPHLLSSFTGRWTTFHWIYDVVTSEFVPRKSFTGEREGHRFRWRQDGVIHGVWKETEQGPMVVPLESGQLAQLYQDRERALQEETRRRIETARGLAVGSSPTSPRVLADALPRLDEHWTKRGQRDSIVSDLFGERPRLFAQRGESWIEIQREIEYVAVLDAGLVLLTLQEGRQALFHPERWELAPLPDPPAEFRSKLATRWDRAGGFYDNTDPLPRDLQYRRSYDTTQGTAQYFNFVEPHVTRVMVLYAIEAGERVLRVVDLPEAWGISERPAGALPVPSP